MPQKQDGWSWFQRARNTKAEFNPAADNGSLPTPKRRWWDWLWCRPVKSVTRYQTTKPSNEDEARQLDEYNRSRIPRGGETELGYADTVI